MKRGISPNSKTLALATVFLFVFPIGFSVPIPAHTSPQQELNNLVSQYLRENYAVNTIEEYRANLERETWQEYSEEMQTLSVAREASYIIGIDGTTIYAVNGKTGEKDYSGTDAATVIQNAIDALTSGGKIAIQEGTYLIGAQIGLMSNLTFDWSKATFNLANNVNVYMIKATTKTNINMYCGIANGNRANQTAGGLISFDDVDRFLISGGYFTSAYEYMIDISQSTGQCTYGIIENVVMDGPVGDDQLSIDGGQHITVMNCVGRNQYGSIAGRAYSCFETEDGAYNITFIGCKASGDKTNSASHQGFQVKKHAGEQSPKDVRLIGCHAENFYNYGFMMEGIDTNNRISGVELVDCTACEIRNGQGLPVYMKYVNDSKVIGGKFYNSSEHGVRLAGYCKHIQIIGVTVTGAYQGFSTDNADNTNIIYVGCVAYSNVGKGFYFRNLHKSAIIGCIAYNNGWQEGIRLETECDDNIITNCFLYDNSNWGINIANANCENNIIESNKLWGNSIAQISDSGTNTVVRHNTGFIAE